MNGKQQIIIIKKEEKKYKFLLRVCDGCKFKLIIFFLVRTQ